MNINQQKILLLIFLYRLVGGELVEAAVEFELPDAVEAAKKMFDDWVDNNVTVAADLRQVINFIYFYDIEIYIIINNVFYSL